MPRSQARPGAGAVDHHRTGDPSTDQAFASPSTSLQAFVKDGTDREFRKLVYALLTLADLMGRNRKHFARYIGVTDPQFMMIVLITETPNATVGMIAERMNVSSQFVTAEVAKLIKRDIIAKRPNESDRRSAILQLTPKGQRLLRELGPLRRRINDLTFSSLTEDRARKLQDMLAALISDAKNAVHELQAPHIRGLRAPSADAAAHTSAAEAPRSAHRAQARRS
jgi:DNA-binding MarR family transcriptional regulator